MVEIIRKLKNEIRAGGISLLFFEKSVGFLYKKTLRLLGGFLPLNYILEGFIHKPKFLYLGTTNRCNANCVFCAYQYMSSKKGVMSMETFKKAVNDYAAMGGGDISFTPPIGEPLMDTHLIDRIKYCRGIDNIKFLSFFTNGILLFKTDLEALLSSGVNQITVSVGGWENDNYKKIYRVDQFDNVTSGIIKLCEKNREMNNPVRIILDIRTHISLSELKKMKTYKELAQYVDKVIYKYNFDNWSGTITKNDMPGLMRLRKAENKTLPCYILYYPGPSVMWDGKVTACSCREINGDSDLIIGNINEAPLDQIWRSEKLKSIRLGFEQGQVPNHCKKCNHYINTSFLRTPTNWIYAKKILVSSKKYMQD